MDEGAAGPVRGDRDAERMAVAVCMATGPGRVVEVALAMRPGSCVRDALADPAVRAALRDAGMAAGVTEPDIGIWGRRCPADRPVRAGDRIEVYRPLRVDPMTARRERFRKQGVRATGLFASPAKSSGGVAG